MKERGRHGSVIDTFQRKWRPVWWAAPWMMEIWRVPGWHFTLQIHNVTPLSLTVLKPQSHWIHLQTMEALDSKLFTTIASSFIYLNAHGSTWNRAPNRQITLQIRQEKLHINLKWKQLAVKTDQDIYVVWFYLRAMSLHTFIYLKPYMWPWTTKLVISSTVIFLAIANNTLHRSKL